MGNALAKTFLLFFGLMIGGSIFLVSFLNKINVVKNKAEVKIGTQTIIADVVKTEAEREKGLSGRESLGVNEGMLFVFDSEDMYPFWMKDMKFPIDVIWIRNNYIVGFAENVSPKVGSAPSETIFSPPQSIDRALELRAGRVKLLRAQVGDQVKSRPLVDIAGS
ncbi:MAG: DUF192 domain-containing protein [Candidatus Paceibacterota bacterium]|jgi:hypothetical protein